MQYTNVDSPKHTYYFYHTLLQKTVFRERENAGQLTLGLFFFLAGFQRGNLKRPPRRPTCYSITMDLTE
jgi:hypothetical protein